MLENEFYTQEQHWPFEYFELGDFLLESGEVPNDAKLAYAVHGELNEAKDNAILFTIMFSGTSKNMAHYISEGLALDPTKYCIILPNQLGNGLSTSPLINGVFRHKPATVGYWLVHGGSADL